MCNLCNTTNISCSNKLRFIFLIFEILFFNNFFAISFWSKLYVPAEPQQICPSGISKLYFQFFLLDLLEHYVFFVHAALNKLNDMQFCIPFFSLLLIKLSLTFSSKYSDISFVNSDIFLAFFLNLHQI